MATDQWSTECQPFLNSRPSHHEAVTVCRAPARLALGRGCHSRGEFPPLREPASLLICHLFRSHRYETPARSGHFPFAWSHRVSVHDDGDRSNQEIGGSKQEVNGPKQEVDGTKQEADGTKQEADVALPPARNGSAELYEVAHTYVAAILNTSDTTLPRLACPVPLPTRYEYLRTPNAPDSPKNLKYFFAVDLRQSVEILPRLLGSIVEVVRYLGPAACALSIVEGHSDDGTFEVLDLLRSELAELGLQYFFLPSTTDPREGERISALAELRNLALKPLVSDPAAMGADRNTSVIFLNDVAICAEDILELVHQRTFQAADMTCAMDWTYVGRDPTFYDIWISRTLKGDIFFQIPPDRSWDYAWNLFWNDDATRSRFNNKLPFQVFSCWNGAAVFTAAPVLGPDADPPEEKRVAFRASREGECYSGEPELFCKDLWWTGHGRIAVVPSVNLEYSTENAEKIKAQKGYTSKWVEQENAEDSRITWEATPPAEVKCMAVFENQFWEPWNKTLS